jgi:hypothetical protein
MIAILMALEFALLSILTFVLESMSIFNLNDEVTTMLGSMSVFNHELSMSIFNHAGVMTMQCMQCIKTFVLESMSIFKMMLGSMSVFNHELSMSIFNHAGVMTMQCMQCIKTFVLESMSIFKTMTMQCMQCIKTFVLESMSIFKPMSSIFKTFVLELISANNVSTIQCIKIFVMCITALELFKFFMFSVPAMRSKVLISKALMGRIKALEETLKFVAEIDIIFFRSGTGNEGNLVDEIMDAVVDEIKEKLEAFLQSDGMDDNTKAAVELQFMNHVKVVYCLKKKHGYFIFGSKW